MYYELCKSKIWILINRSGTEGGGGEGREGEKRSVSGNYATAGGGGGG